MLRYLIPEVKDLRGIRAFLGPKVVHYLVLGMISGTFLFFVEFAFAIVLQSFMVAIGILSVGPEQTPYLVSSFGFAGVLGLMFLVGCLRSLLQWANVFFSNAASEAMKHVQRSRVLQWAFYGKTVSSAKVSTLFNENVWAAAASVASLQTVIIYIPAILLLAISLLMISPVPMLLATLLLSLLALFMSLVDRKIGILGQRIAQETNDTNASVLRNIKNLLLVKIYGTQEKELSLVSASLGRYYQDMVAYGRLSGLKFALPQILGIGMLCALAFFTSYWGKLGTEMLVAYFYLFVRFVQILGEAAKTMASFRLYGPQTAIVAKWWHEVYRSEIESSRQVPIKDKEVRGPFVSSIGWRFQSVNFNYGGPTVIENFSLEIPPGSVWVITGPSGVGKSTLLSLLLGTVEPRSGRIEVFSNSSEGLPLMDVRAQLLESVGYVGPEPFLVEGTVRENLSYGLSEQPTEAMIQKALSNADCDFVLALPLGLDHRLSEQGEGLSAGQKQRLALARALLRRPKVLVLDEATANLDTVTERRLVATLKDIQAGMTIVAVTHREALLSIATHHTQL